MTAAESSELKLPSWQTAASMLEGTALSPVPAACPSSPFPVPSGPRAALAQPVASYGARERPADHRATLGELVVFVAKNDPRLEALDATFAARRKEVFNAGHFEVFEASLKQRTRAFLKLPEKARSHKMIFMAETKLDLLAVNSSADVSAAALGKLWEAEEKEAAEGTTKYAKQALREATQHRLAHELWLRDYHRQPPPTKPWLPEALAEARKAGTKPRRNPAAPAARAAAAAPAVLVAAVEPAPAVPPDAGNAGGAKRSRQPSEKAAAAAAAAAKKPR